MIQNERKTYIFFNFCRVINYVNQPWTVMLVCKTDMFTRNERSGDDAPDDLSIINPLTIILRFARWSQTTMTKNPIQCAVTMVNICYIIYLYNNYKVIHTLTWFITWHQIRKEIFFNSFIFPTLYYFMNWQIPTLQTLLHEFYRNFK